MTRDMGSRTWQEDWPFRIYEILHERGFHSMTQFIDSRPMVSLLDLAEDLGHDVAAIQVEGLWFREADEQGMLDQALASLLIRRIREEIPGGWASGDKFEHHLACAFASWGCVADVVLPDPEQHRVWEFLHDLAPAPGWLPTVPYDDLTTHLLDELQRALDRSQRSTSPDERV